MQTLCAQWDSTTQQPYNITPIDRLVLTHSNGVPPKEWQTRNRAGFYEFVPVALGEGEGLDNPVYAFAGGVISEGGTVIPAQDVISRQQIERHNQVLAMCDAYGQDVVILGELLAEIGLTFPCTQDDVKAAIKALPNGLRRDGLMGDFAAAYQNCKDNMTDEDIAAVASVIGGAV